MQSYNKSYNSSFNFNIEFLIDPSSSSAEHRRAKQVRGVLGVSSQLVEDGGGEPVGGRLFVQVSHACGSEIKLAKALLFEERELGVNAK